MTERFACSGCVPSRFALFLIGIVPFVIAGQVRLPEQPETDLRVPRVLPKRAHDRQEERRLAAQVLALADARLAQR